MSKKTNIRSFRYSDEVAEILESMSGNSLNEKFENLVLKCHAELPRIERDIKWAREDLIRLRKEYWMMLKASQKISGQLETIVSVLDDVTRSRSGSGEA